MCPGDDDVRGCTSNSGGANSGGGHDAGEDEAPPELGAAVPELGAAVLELGAAESGHGAGGGRGGQSCASFTARILMFVNVLGPR